MGGSRFGACVLRVIEVLRIRNQREREGGRADPTKLRLSRSCSLILVIAVTLITHHRWGPREGRPRRSRTSGFRRAAVWTALKVEDVIQ